MAVYAICADYDSPLFNGGLTELLSKASDSETWDYVSEYFLAWLKAATDDIRDYDDSYERYCNEREKLQNRVDARGSIDEAARWLGANREEFRQKCRRFGVQAGRG